MRLVFYTRPQKKYGGNFIEPKGAVCICGIPRDRDYNAPQDRHGGEVAFAAVGSSPSKAGVDIPI